MWDVLIAVYDLNRLKLAWIKGFYEQYKNVKAHSLGVNIYS